MANCVALAQYAEQLSIIIDRSDKDWCCHVAIQVWDVRCSADLWPVQIRLGGLSLSGTIPSFSSNPALAKVYLFGNQLSGTIRDLVISKITPFVHIILDWKNH